METPHKKDPEQESPKESLDENLRNFIMAHPLFRMISPKSEAFEEFLQSIIFRSYHKNDFVYSQGQMPSFIYLVYEGEIHIIRYETNSSKPILVGIEGRGNLFGEVSFLSHEPRSSSASVAMTSGVFLIPGQAFLKLLSKEPVVGQGLVLLLSKRLRERISHQHSENPARIVFLTYPENEARGNEIGKILAKLLVNENPGPVALCTFRSDGEEAKNSSHLNLLDLMDKLSDISIEEIKSLIPKKNSEPYDIISGYNLFRSDLRYEEMAAGVPSLLGRMRKYYSIILIEASFNCDNPVLSRMVSESTRIVLLRALNKNNNGPLPEDIPIWESVAYRCMELQENFSERIITVSDEENGLSMRKLNEKLPKSSMLYHNHIRLQGYRKDVASENNPDYMKGMHRLARTLSGTLRGLALGGGGARSLSHIGVLEVMEKANIHFDAVIGTSMGAVIGAAYAMGLSAAEISEKISNIIPDASSILDKRLPLVSFFRGDKLNKILIKGFGGLKFEDSHIPFYCNASDLNSGDMIIFDRGYLTTALRASSGLPGIFPPLKLGRYRLIDGAVLNNLPGNILREKGCNHVVGINVSPMEDIYAAKTEVNPDKGYIRGIIDYWSMPPIINIVYRSITMEGRELLKLRIQDFDFVLTIDTSSFELFDFKMREQLIEKGRMAAEQNLDEIKEALFRKKIGVMDV